MALRAKVLRKKAEKFEAKQLEVHKVTKEHVSALESLLQDVYVIRRPKANDYKVRRELICIFNEIAKEIYGNSKKAPFVVEFGSFVMDLFSATSDLDLSVNFNTNADNFSREKKIQTLRKFAKKLYFLQSKGHVYGVFPITTAKVPIVKVVDRGTGVECDISVENRDGILKSRIIHIISSIDERFHKLSFLMKNWAKAHNINSSKEKTLNSLSIILLVAFHLQTRNPPILPPFSVIFKDGTDPETVMKSMANFVNYGKSNEESLAELFFTLLIKLFSVEKLWPKGICASTWQGSWISKTWGSKVACISVEDFTDQSQNVARAVGQTEVKRINKCIEISLRYVFSFLDGKIEGPKLKELLFGGDNTPFPLPIPKSIPKLQQVAALPDNSSQSNLSRTVLIGKKRKQETTVIIKKKPMVETQHATPFPLPIPKSIPKLQQGASIPKLQQGAALPDNSPQSNLSRTVLIGKKRKQETTVIIKKKPMVETQHATLFEPRNREQHMAGWDRTYTGNQYAMAGGYGGALPVTAGDWGVTPQSATTGCGGVQQPRTISWGGVHQPVAGSWGRTQQAGSWGRTQQPVDGSWGGFQQPVTQSLAGVQQPVDGSWGGFQPPVTQSRAGVQQPVAGQWNGGSYPLWTKPNYRSF